MGLLTADPSGFDLSRHCELSPCQKHHDSGSLAESATSRAAPANAGQTALARFLLPEHAVGGHPGIDTLLDPDGDRDDAAIFALEVGQHPPPFPLLDVLDVELR